MPKSAQRGKKFNTNFGKQSLATKNKFGAAKARGGSRGGSRGSTRGGGNFRGNNNSIRGRNSGEIRGNNRYNSNRAPEPQKIQPNNQLNKKTLEKIQNSEFSDGVQPSKKKNKKKTSTPNLKDEEFIEKMRKESRILDNDGDQEVEERKVDHEVVALISRLQKEAKVALLLEAFENFDSLFTESFLSSCLEAVVGSVPNFKEAILEMINIQEEEPEPQFLEDEFDQSESSNEENELEIEDNDKKTEIKKSSPKSEESDEEIDIMQDEEE